MSDFELPIGRKDWRWFRTAEDLHDATEAGDEAFDGQAAFRGHRAREFSFRTSQFAWKVQAEVIMWMTAAALAAVPGSDVVLVDYPECVCSSILPGGTLREPLTQSGAGLFLLTNTTGSPISRSGPVRAPCKPAPRGARL